MVAAMSALPRPARVVLAGLVGGALVGVLLALAATPAHRARATVVVAPALRTTGTALETTTATIAALVGSSTVLNNVTDALGRPRGALAGAVHARPRHGTAIVEITVDQASGIEAERVAQQILVALPALAASRLPHAGGTPVLAVDSPGGSARALGRPYARNALLGALAGALLALAALFVVGARSRPRAAAAPAASPQPVTPQPTPVAPRKPAPAPAPEPPPVPAPEPAPAFEAPGTPRRGRFADLERIAAAETDQVRREELELYLDQLRGHVLPDGTLPPNFAGLVEQVFGSY